MGLLQGLVWQLRSSFNFRIGSMVDDKGFDDFNHFSREVEHNQQYGQQVYTSVEKTKKRVKKTKNFWF